MPRIATRTCAYCRRPMLGMDAVHRSCEPRWAKREARRYLVRCGTWKRTGRGGWLAPGSGPGLVITGDRKDARRMTRDEADQWAERVKGHSVRA